MAVFDLAAAVVLGLLVLTVGLYYGFFSNAPEPPEIDEEEAKRVEEELRGRR